MEKQEHSNFFLKVFSNWQYNKFRLTEKLVLFMWE